ncbi:MAG: BMP family ABC transporter substrate-binding protein [Spirochaetaceae bacterium]|nr:MAG: BMP family ABC transporter substrate-binding protein [Spirochaetaceae bacterium]
MAGVVMAGGGREAAPAVDDGALRIAVVMPSATNDMAFSQSMWTALTAVQAEMGGPSALQLSYSENMFVVPDAAGALRDYASQGYDIVIGHGSQYGSSIQDIAPDFPDTVFAWGTDVNTFGLDNVYAYTAAAEQGGYVNGVLAALMTRSGQVGVTGPVEVGDAKTYIDGFVNGVRQTDSAVRVSQSWTGSFSDVAAMTAAASTHIANGADALTGSSQSVVGSVGVARESDGVLWFGTQADQTDLAPELVVASQIYDWTDMLREIIANRQAGRMGGESYILTFANDGLKMAFNPAIDIPAEAMEAALAAIEGIKNGQIRAMP